MSDTDPQALAKQAGLEFWLLEIQDPQSEYSHRACYSGGAVYFAKAREIALWTALQRMAAGRDKAQRDADELGAGYASMQTRQENLEAERDACQEEYEGLAAATADYEALLAERGQAPAERDKLAGDLHWSREERKQLLLQFTDAIEAAEAVLGDCPEDPLDAVQRLVDERDKLAGECLCGELAAERDRALGQVEEGKQLIRQLTLKQDKLAGEVERLKEQLRQTVFGLPPTPDEYTEEHLGV